MAFTRGNDRFQTEIQLQKRDKGCYLITNEILDNKELASAVRETAIGMLHLFVKHTSAGLTVNENFDHDVRTDMDMAMDKIVPESLPWQHVDEGPDDSASHTKSSLIGSSVTIPITQGKLNLGTWQGIYLTEFRVGKRGRSVVATVL
ncbi:hypothetical protein ACM66B_001293 [Microbotryomycetes sp. NB124-2]